MHEFKIGDYVKWDEGEMVYTGEIMSLTERSALVSYRVDWEITEKRISLSKLTYLPPINLECEEYRRLVRFETDPIELVSGNTTANVHNVGGYRFCIEDLLAGMERMLEVLEESEIVCAIWFSCIQDEIYAQLSELEDGQLYSESDVISSLAAGFWNGMDDIHIDYDTACEDIEEAKHFIEDRDKPMLKRRYPRYVKEKLIERLYDDSAMSLATEDEVALYRIFAEELASAGSWSGLRAVGYGCYGGNRAFPCDWERSRDCILALFEIEDDAKDKATYADTLGYIYYYGRCNGGVPEYDLAYKYFSFAAFYGVYEARYKVADMIRNGYGIPKCPEIANRMIGELYDENIKYIRNGIFECKFADVALRMGGIYDNEYSGELYKALYYYTQAEFAIRMRMMNVDCYGDAKVCENISTALNRVKEKLEFKALSSGVYRSLYFMDGELSDGKKYDIVIKKQRKLSYKITFAPHRGGERRKMFLTLPEIGLCGLFSKLTATYRAYEPLDESLLDRVITVDERDGTELLYDGNVVFSMDGDIVIKNGGKAQNKKYRFVSVSFGTPKLYDYLCDDLSVKGGDTVWVNAAGEEKEVTVCRVFEKKESELSFPIKVYKKVIARSEG